VTRIRVDEGEGTERQRVYALRPEMGAALNQLAHAVSEYTQLPFRIWEGIRYRIARINECPI
jgi:hypothetical protein